MVRAVLLDIEGTIAPLSFVKEVLFPYSLEKLEEFLKEHSEDPEVREILRETQELVGRPLSLEEAIGLFRKWIEEDRKVTPLKELQGLIWEEGFRSGKLVAPLYEDAYEKLKEWKEMGIPLYVYSSGSVRAQKLFFSHTNYGDVTDFFRGFYDTRIGPKKEKRSYEKIVREIGLSPQDVLFISDNPDELRAASQAGLQVLQSVREGVQPSEEFRKIYSFREIEL
ncbi:MAG: acireductone synthase [Aquificae bacterium]|nr:acireductone synthase [Aquificota bacterium]